MSNSRFQVSCFFLLKVLYVGFSNLLFFQASWHVLCQIIPHLFYQSVLDSSQSQCLVLFSEFSLWDVPFPQNFIFGYYLRPVLKFLSFYFAIRQHDHIQLYLFGNFGDLRGGMNSDQKKVHFLLGFLRDPHPHPPPCTITGLKIFKIFLFPLAQRDLFLN